MVLSKKASVYSMSVIYAYTYVDSVSGSEVENDRQFDSVYAVCVAATKRLCLTMSEHAELERAQGLFITDPARIHALGISEVRIYVRTADTWSNRALACVRNAIEQCRTLQRGEFLTMSERLFWANEAKRLVGVKQAVIERSRLAHNQPKCNY